jgi:hypothetical protein
LKLFGIAILNEIASMAALVPMQAMERQRYINCGSRNSKVGVEKLKVSSLEPVEWWNRKNGWEGGRASSVQT